MAEALSEASRQTGVGLLFDRRLIAGLRARALRGVMTSDEAFDRLLKRSGLKAVKVRDDQYALVRDRRAPTPQRDELPEDGPAIPDILVVGHRTFNTDVQRRANDIQPYRVLSSHDIAAAQASSIDDLLRSRLSADQQRTSYAQIPLPVYGMMVSNIDLHGLGTDQTLVLVDGRRMPSFPGTLTFGQADVNALPMTAIERIETYGGTTGGLYGPGATGGTVNIVLRQDLPKVWAQGRAGINQRGDGAQWQLDGGLSFKAFNDKTEFSIAASYSHDDGLRFGDRPFVQRAIVLRADRSANPAIPYGRNVNIVSTDGRPLTLLAKFGGQSLGATTTNIPANSGGAGGDEIALLKAGAGKFDLSLGPDGTGSAQSLLTRSQFKSVVANIRQHVDSRVEIFGNLLRIENAGTAFGPALSQSQYYDRGDPGNPFRNSILLTIPAANQVAAYSTRFVNYRVTTGLIADLPREWKFEADAAIGKSAVYSRGRRFSYVDQPDVLSPGTGLADYLASQQIRYTDVHSENRLQDYSVRLAGSPGRLPAGRTTTTVSVEHRMENVPNYTADLVTAHKLVVDSVAGEARVPLIRESSALVPLRSLQLQIGARADRTTTTVPAYFGTSDIDGAELPPPGFIAVPRTTVAFTVGAKTEPVEGLLLRASYATGFRPPTPGQFITYVQLTSGQIFSDPYRAGRDPANEDSQLQVLTGGSAALKPEQVGTLSFGAVAQPKMLPGLRMSVDYSRITKSHAILGLTVFNLGDFEQEYPGRVIRAPLTEEDKALGFTEGFVTQVDATSINRGRSILQTIDADLEYACDTPFGHIRAHGTATWTPDYRSIDVGSGVQFAGKINGPLRMRANGGLEWQKGRLGATIDAQYYSAYDITTAGDADSSYNENRVLQQGSARVPAQVYLDAGLTYRMTLGGGPPVDFTLGIKNLLDKAPPLEVPTLDFYGLLDFSVGYSTYGDPRGRRFLLTAAVSL
ncbi:TonB-dependent receptor [Sphingomonas faeni]|uniref:TonB-dependent receptor n=1 Tax=Sphingomonas faeni TaxID=185950 RepID=UPI0033530F74